MDLRTIAKTAATPSVGSFGFPIDPAKLSALLRALADQLDAKTVWPQKVNYREEVSADDYTLSTISIIYAVPDPAVAPQPAPPATP